MARLEKLCFSLPWSPKQCRAAFLQSTFAAFGLFGPEELLGYISIYHFLPEMEILNLAVLPAIRRRGAARRMLNGVLQLGRKMGMQKVSLEVRESNFPAICLYEQTGFVQRGIRKKYYPDNHENALIMIRAFPGAQDLSEQASVGFSPCDEQGPENDVRRPIAGGNNTTVTTR